jgi:branched-subunit amino acid aminotransferase/4-amino-4-deoxychorismate lyase
MLGWINGEIKPVDKMKLPVLDRAVQYGEGLYETMLVDRETVPLLDRHRQRLRSSCERIGLPYPGNDRVSNAVQETIDANTSKRKDRDLDQFVLKLLLTGGTGDSLYRKPSPEPGLVLMPRPFPDQVDTWRNEGGIARFVPASGNTGTSLGQVKSTSRLAEALALERVHRSDDEYREALFIDDDHRVLQGAKSNVFVLLQDTWFTPPVSDGLLPGIAREVLLEHADSGSVSERIVYTRDVLHADGVMVTNAVTGPVPIRKIVAPSLLAFDRGPLTFSVPDSTVLDDIWTNAL